MSEQEMVDRRANSPDPSPYFHHQAQYPNADALRASEIFNNEGQSAEPYGNLAMGDGQAQWYADNANLLTLEDFDS